MLHKFVLYIRTNRTWFVFDCGKSINIFVQFSDLLIYSKKNIRESMDEKPGSTVREIQEKAGSIKI